jgi:hypothetical protein
MTADRIARVRTRSRPDPRRAAAQRLLDQACRNIINATFGRRRLLYAYAGALALFGKLGYLDLDEAGARLLQALQESGWPGRFSGPRRGSPRETVLAAYRWAQGRDPAAAAQSLWPSREGVQP